MSSNGNFQRRRSPKSVRRPLDNLLSYLADIGYGDLYVPKEVPPPPKRAEHGVPTSPSVARPGSSANPPKAAKSAVERKTDLDALRARALVCESCALAVGRRTVVFGAGNPDADLMIVGEGPGAVEDREGEPFVGPSGQLLDKIIEAIDLQRSEIYIANVVKCRPPGDRDPESVEVTACRHFLEGQIRAVAPRVILAVGRVAAQTLLGTDLPLG
ncbi:MAG: uracil-DNA glycosylase, partial [Thermoanaerobaculia bacterium]|nr:uracil-DNA glycosylase [Thermoanaerobaculia bacterium]